MTIMYDSVNSRSIPATPSDAIIAGYVDGKYAWSDADWNWWHGRQLVRIAVFASTNDGQVLDVEPGNDPPSAAVGWVRMRRAAGQVRPTVYCADDGHGQAGWTYSDVVRAFENAGEPQPDYWLAHGVLRPGVAAVQTVFLSAYDISVTDGIWPQASTPPDLAAVTELLLNGKL